MNCIQLCKGTFKQLCFLRICRINTFIRNYCVKNNSDENTIVENKSTAAATDNIDLDALWTILKNSENKAEDDSENGKRYTFPALLRHSKFIDLGDPTGKTVIGKIFHVVNNDLYIDFGWKFHCVCPRPKKNPIKYTRGAKVKLLINDLELSSRFLGASSDLTLLEADCVLLGLVGNKDDM